MRSLSLTLESFAPLPPGAGLLLPPDRRHSPPDPGLQVYPIACLSTCLGLSYVPLFVTPWTVNWSGLPFPSPGDLPYPGIEPASPVSPTLQADSLPDEPSGKAVVGSLIMLY